MFCVDVCLLQREYVKIICVIYMPYMSVCNNGYHGSQEGK